VNLPQVPPTIILTSEMPTSIYKIATHTSITAINSTVILLSIEVALVDVAMQKSFGSLLERAMRIVEGLGVVFEVMAG
jgi:hypothetical protein